MYFSYYNGEKRQIQAFFCKSFLFCIWNYEKYGIYYRHNADLWCNGSTSDSGSLCWGSNPYRSAIFLLNTAADCQRILHNITNCIYENKFSPCCLLILLFDNVPNLVKFKNEFVKTPSFTHKTYHVSRDLSTGPTRVWSNRRMDCEPRSKLNQGENEGV